MKLDQTENLNSDYLKRNDLPVPYCELLHDRFQSQHREPYGVIVNAYGVRTILCEYHYEQCKSQFENHFLLTPHNQQ